MQKYNLFLKIVIFFPILYKSNNLTVLVFIDFMERADAFYVMLLQPILIPKWNIG
jgi:hypothetical protein